MCNLDQRNRAKCWSVCLLFLSMTDEGLLSRKFMEVCSLHQLDSSFINLSVGILSFRSAIGDHLAENYEHALSNRFIVGTEISKDYNNTVHLSMLNVFMM